MYPKKAMVALICLELIVVLIPLGCGPKKESATEPIRIGSIYPMTGSVARNGEIAKHAIELALDIINNKHDLDLPFARTEGIPALGNRKIEVVFGDSQGESELGLSETERLITEQKVVIVTGCYQSSVTKTASQAAERLETPFIDADAISPDLHQRGFKWFFQITPDTLAAGRDMLEVLAGIDKAMGVDTKSMKIGLMYEDTDFGRDTMKASEEVLTKAGYNISTQIFYPHETSDLSSEVMKLKSEGVEILWQGGYVSDSILFVKTLKELGYMPKIIMAATGGATNPDFLGTLGADGDYWVTAEYFSLGALDKKPMMKAVNDMYKEKYGDNLDSVAIRSFTSMFVVADALERAASTEKAKIRDALMATDLSSEDVITTWDGVKFDDEGYNVRGTMVFHQVRGGEYKLAWPMELAEVEIVFPAPGWDER
jgi:branched-chain amino acid transport system substrate-binding protein